MRMNIDVRNVRAYLRFAETIGERETRFSFNCILIGPACVQRLWNRRYLAVRCTTYDICRVKFSRNERPQMKLKMLHWSRIHRILSADSACLLFFVEIERMLNVHNWTTRRRKILVLFLLLFAGTPGHWDTKPRASHKLSEIDRCIAISEMPKWTKRVSRRNLLSIWNFYQMRIRSFAWTAERRLLLLLLLIVLIASYCVEVFW